MIKIIVITCLVGATSLDDCGESESRQNIPFGQNVNQACNESLDNITAYTKKHGMMIKEFRCTPYPAK